METPDKLDLSALQDGKLHLIAFCGEKFVYLVADPEGSGWLVQETLERKFPFMVGRMLDDRTLSLGL